MQEQENETAQLERLSPHCDQFPLNLDTFSKTIYIIWYFN